MRILDDKDIVKYVALCDTSPTGLVWVVMPNTRTLGSVGGPALNRMNNKGYYYGLIQGRTLLAHRVVFYLANNYWPEQVDHIDGVRTNNQVDNLRGVLVRENAHNRVCTGTVYHKGRRKKHWQARIRDTTGRTISLGYFMTQAEAQQRYLEAKVLYHPTAPERCYVT